MSSARPQFGLAVSGSDRFNTAPLLGSEQKVLQMHVVKGPAPVILPHLAR